ncbi:MAG: hypothetical protein IMX00_04015 [Limnochordales bacterium]|nr:hypothetical protein [Limnochordales bacterium]
MPRIVFPWLPNQAAISSFLANTDVITHISPTGLSLSSDGSIKQAENPDIATVCQIAREKGVKCVPLVVNEGFSAASAAAILCDPVRRRQAADRLCDLVEENDWDGINLDFEGPWAFRSEYTAFVARVADRLRPRSKLVTLDVVAQYRPPTGNSEHPNSAWADPYDYPALGQLVDLFIIMGYDFHSRSGPPGPVGPAWWLERVLEYATAHVQPERIVLGLPFYGYHWIVDEDGKTISGNYVSYSRAEEIRLQHQVGKSWDYDGQCRHFHFRDADGRENIVFYDDARSLARRLRLVDLFHLAGVAFWSLGQEDPEVWSEIRAWHQQG